MNKSLCICALFFFANCLLVLGDQNTLLNLIFEVLGRGVSLNGPGTVLKIGLVTVPFDTLCKNTIVEPNFCRVCMLDCKFAHKATSGKCGPHPSRRGETTCVCDYTAKTILPTVSSICPASYTFNFLELETLDQRFDSQIAAILRLRYQKLLCSGNFLGCETDCIHNHGANSGACVGDYCICDYSK